MLVRLPRGLPGLVVGLLASTCLVACSGDDSGSTSDGVASASSSPATQATGSPFTGSLDGPDLAKAGGTITVTITNTGRLPNGFQLEFNPAGAAFATPEVVMLAPGQSADLQVQVNVSPLNINLEATSGGLGVFLDTLEIGSTS